MNRHSNIFVCRAFVTFLFLIAMLVAVVAHAADNALSGS